MPRRFTAARELLLVLTILSFFFTANSQEKGLRPIESSAIRSSGKTRALVIGISDYEYIDKLNFAHRDAEIFADYLKKQNVNPADITLLTNQDAKRGSIITELLRIAQLSTPGDNLVFYFSGHGDIESITKFKNGYLLTYDTYTNNYMAGALSVNDLKDIFVSLCDRDVKVMVITDACRSGKLAGGAEGKERTAGLLKPVWINEIKILSSEPDQYSQEGSQWGNGRGVFSFYLINGLEGQADANKDSLITINELNQFVGVNVAEVTNGKQQPVIDGPNRFSTVVANLKLKQAVARRSGAGEASFFGNFIIPDDSCTVYLRKMNEAIEAKNFKGRDPLSATMFYEKLKTCTIDKEIILSANSRLLSAMMNDAQDIVNNTFIGKRFVEEKEYGYARDLFDEILDHNDLRLPYQQPLTNLKRYLKVSEEVLWGLDVDFNELDRILDTALREEPDAAYLLTVKGIIELRKGNYTRSIEILEQATKLGPGWLTPKYYLGMGYGYKREYKKALDYYNEVLQKDPEAKTFDCAKCIEERINEYQKRISRIKFDKFSNDPKLSELDSLRNYLADNIDSADFYHQLGNVYNKRNHPKRDSVYHYFTLAITLDPWDMTYMYSLLEFMRKESYGQEEIRHWVLQYLKLREKEDIIDDDDDVYLNEVLLYSYIFSKDPEKAVDIAIRLEEAGFYTCKDLKKLRKPLGKLDRYIELLKKCDTSE